jgi:hypothetical protein
MDQSAFLNTDGVLDNYVLSFEPEISALTGEGSFC